MASVFPIQYFLGANAPGGFYSLYSQLIPLEEARAVYILKGGPGCGKSTLMRRVAERAEAAGLRTEYILCSGDPESLDALVLPELKAALADGTPPHVMEPKYPGAVEQLVNLGEAYDRAALYAIRREIMDCKARYQACYWRAWRCLDASAEVLEDARSAVLTQSLSDKLAGRARGILSRTLPRKKGAEPGHVTQRLLGGPTCRGQLCLYDTALAQCDTIYELADGFGLAHELLVHLLAGAVERGYSPVACPDPMASDRLAHLLVPEAGVAFLSTAPGLSLPVKPFRRIRLEQAADSTLLRRSRPRMRFSRRVSSALMDEAVDSLAQAKALHDELEDLYHPYVDFDRVETLTRAVGDELLALV